MNIWNLITKSRILDFSTKAKLLEKSGEFYAYEEAPANVAKQIIEGRK